MATKTEEAAAIPAPEQVEEAKEAVVVEEAPKPVVDKAKKERKRKPRLASLNHPPYFEMIREAIVALDGRAGSSAYAIGKRIGEQHGEVLPANYRKVLAVQLRSFAAKGRLVKVKASFKLSAAEEKKAMAAAKRNNNKKRTPRSAAKKAPAAKAVAPARPARAKRARKAQAPAPAKPRSARSGVAKKANKARA